MLDAHVLEGLDTLDSDGVNVFLGMGVVAIGTLAQPLHQVEAWRLVQRDRIAVEQVHDNGQISLLGKEVGHELAVLPNTNDVGQV